MAVVRGQDVKQMLEEAVAGGRLARAELLRRVKASGRVVDITELRKADNDIKLCEDELGRMKCL